MSPDLLSFLFLVTSTAIVLGVAVTLRGLWGLVGDLSPRLPDASASDASGNAAGSSTSLDLAADGTTPSGDGLEMTASPATTSATSTTHQVRDMRESLVMTIGGVFILAGALIALATLIHSA